MDPDEIPDMLQLVPLFVSLGGATPAPAITSPHPEETRINLPTLTHSPDKGLTLTTGEGDIEVKFGGRIMYDMGYASADDDLKTPPGGGTALEFTDGSEFRRARLFASGTLYENIDFKAQYDFAGGSPVFKDVWMGTDFENLSVKVGHFKEPFGLEELTSSKYITFNERSSGTEAFSPSRNSGVMLYGSCASDSWTWAIGGFRDADGAGNDQTSDSGEYNVTARVTTAPMYSKEDGQVLHLGLAGSVRSDISGANRFRARPENHLSPRLLDTGSIASDGYNLYGLEAAYGQGPFSVQAEYMMTDVDVTGASSATLSSYYLMGSYFLTGEHRPYKASQGTFSRVKPTNDFGADGNGAVEVTARYSMTDLNDGTTVMGGELNNLTGGINWYLNPHTRVMFNYVHSELDKSGATLSDEGSLDAFLVRFQLDF